MLLKANIQVMLHVLIGMKQGDPPSPFFFNIYMNDLCSDLLNSNDI